MYGPKITIEFEKSEKIFLELDRPRDEQDTAVKFVEWFSDARVRQYLSLRYPVGLASEAEWLKTTSIDRDCIVWFIYANDELIGNIGLHKIDQTNSNTELGITICNKNFWGKGIAPAVEFAVLSYGFENIVPGGLHKIFTRAFVKNNRSIRALEKTGVKTVGFKKEQIWKNGEWHDEWLGEAIKENWLEESQEIEKQLGIKNIDLYSGSERL